MDETIEVSLWRGKTEGSYQAFTVPLRANQTVLDVVTWVQRNADPTLSYRFACRVGMCGSCAMTVNGRPRWTCRTHISKVIEDGRVEIGPLANLPVIKDLASDLAPFFEKWQKAKGVFAPGKTRADPSRAHGRRRGHRVHQLRGMLRRLRHGALERRLPGPGRAEPRLDPRQ
jgi:fumarate reductase iron-sulfur subunit